MRAYVKPELYCETFELSQHIAACGIDVNFTSASDAGCQPSLDSDFWGGMTNTVFGEGRDCTTNGGIDVSTIDVYCCTVGTNEAGKLFNS